MLNDQEDTIDLSNVSSQQLLRRKNTEENEEEDLWYDESHGDNNLETVSCKLWWVAAICTLFIGIELFGAYISGSIAILTDATHLISDLSGFILSLLSVNLARKKSDLNYHYGFVRAEVLGSLGSVIIIWALNIWIFYQAISRWINKSYEDLKPTYMLIIACVALVLNLITGIILHCYIGDHNHSNLGHTHDHDNEDHVDRHPPINQANENLNIRTTLIHIIGDIVHTVGIVILAMIIYFEQDWKFLDPMISFIFSFISFSLTIPVIKSVIEILMEKAPEHIDMLKFRKDLKNIEGVIDIHDLHVWTLTIGKPLMSAHITCSKDSDLVLRNASLLSRRLGIYHSTIQVEKKYPTHKTNCNHNAHQ